MLDGGRGKDGEMFVSCMCEMVRGYHSLEKGGGGGWMVEGIALWDGAAMFFSLIANGWVVSWGCLPICPWLQWFMKCCHFRVQPYSGRPTYVDWCTRTWARTLQCVDDNINWWNWKVYSASRESWLLGRLQGLSIFTKSLQRFLHICTFLPQPLSDEINLFLELPRFWKHSTYVWCHQSSCLMLPWSSQL